MPEVLIYSEQTALCHELLAGAFQMGMQSRAVALLGPGSTTKAAECIAFGANTVYVTDDPALGELRVEQVVVVLEEICISCGATTILIGSTRRGKELAGRLAQRLGVGCVTDAVAMRMEGPDLVADRYSLGGNTVATERIATPRKVIGVMPKTFEAAPTSAPNGQVVVVSVSLPAPRVNVAERRPKGSEAVNLEAAEILVGVGKGLERKEDLGIIEDLAKALHGEVGCTRALAADFQWLSEERLIGLSGKKCKPRLYVAVGISGQIQHTVGISGARTIVAINKDKEAPVFKLADYGIVGDLYQLVPQLTRALSA